MPQPAWPVDKLHFLGAIREIHGFFSLPIQLGGLFTQVLSRPDISEQLILYLFCGLSATAKEAFEEAGLLGRNVFPIKIF